jgi:uncharacterized membrane protein/predicted flap endonuclease-1-like 5' DNA nuclease
MAENNNDKMVIAYYFNAEAARAAAEDLKAWDKDNDDVKLGAIGVITVNEHSGEVEVEEVGQRNTKKGALWGTAIGAGLGILTAGIALIPGMIIGAALGAGVGALDHKNLGLTDEDVHNLAAHLKNGGAALGVMCDDFEVAATKAKMLAEGGRIDTYDIEKEAARTVEMMARAQEDASAAVDAAAGEVAEGAALVLTALGLGEDDMAKLEKAGLTKPSELLAMGATPAGRKELAGETGLSEESVMVAVKKMDLMRVDGVGTVYAELLHASGVETVPDLARRNAANLAEKMGEVNETAELTDALPSEENVTGWVDQAKDLPRVIEY